MTEIQEAIAEIETARITLYKLASMIEQRTGKACQYVQVQRIKEGGKCEYAIGRAILEIRDSLRSVPSQSQIAMQTA